MTTFWTLTPVEFPNLDVEASSRKTYQQRQHAAKTKQRRASLSDKAAESHEAKNGRSRQVNGGLARATVPVAAPVVHVHPHTAGGASSADHNDPSAVVSGNRTRNNNRDNVNTQSLNFSLTKAFSLRNERSCDCRDCITDVPAAPCSQGGEDSYTNLSTENGGRGSSGVPPLMMTALSKPHVAAATKEGIGKVHQGGTLRETLSKFDSIVIPGRLDIKCLEIDMTPTELLATPAANIRKRAIRVAMDSGAGDHVASPEDVEGFAIVESANSKAGRNFVAANGGKIINHGQATVHGRTPKGRRVASTFQVAQVTRPLYSVSKLCDAGYKVAFDDKEGVVSKNGDVIHVFKREGGLYVAELMVGCDSPEPTPFVGQGGQK